LKITDVQIGKVKIPLKRPFKTALRTVYFAEDIVIKLKTHSGITGFGSAAPTFAITGDSQDSIVSCLVHHLKPKILGMDVAHIEKLMANIHSSIVNNTSALSAVDMALYDLHAQALGVPLFQLLGGYRNLIFSSLTISANTPEVMVADSLVALDEGFSDLKLKLGANSALDLQCVQAVRNAVGKQIKICVDANQAWQPKDAVRIIRNFEKLGLDIDFVEQPVAAKKMRDLKFVKEHVNTNVLADESVFSPYDALQIIKHNAADMINIKLAKAGGIYLAKKILNICEAAGIECMIGCMLESQVAVTAAAHFAAAHKSILRCDLDPPALLSENPVVGGVSFDGNMLSLSNRPGLGIQDIIDFQPIAS
jgi:L-alanine-DL-glutamate epimerase-like enolase superfamily enzyme